MERIKVYFITTSTNDKASFKYFYSTHKKGIIRELFKGLEPTFWKTNISWFTFLYLDFKIKTYWKRKKEREVLTNKELMLISIPVGVGNTLASNLLFLKIQALPFDFVKTQLQKDYEETGQYKKKGTLKYIRDYLVVTGGLRTLYVGWKVRLFQYTINSLFSVVLLEKLENRFKNLFN